MPLAVQEPQTIEPEYPDVKIRVSGIVLTQWAKSDGPIRMIELGEPDEEGCYAPTFTIDMSKCPHD